MRPKKKQEQKSASGHGGPRPNSGGARAGSGRPRNLQKSCQILAIATYQLVSESTARKWWAEGNGSLKYLLGAKGQKSFGEDWHKKTASQQQEIYEALRWQVEENRRGGWTTRL
jgi:hypothetical protein